MIHLNVPKEKVWPDNKGLGFVAVYYNVAGYTALRENFERFIKRFSWLGDNLLIVELAYFARDFEMTGKHSNIVQLRTDSVMWHKENLMNIGTKHLRSQGFKHVGWLDGDAIIDHDQKKWYAKCEESLKKYNLVQVAERINAKFSDVEREKYLACAEYMLTDTSFAYCYTCGLGWVMPGNLWDKCHYYDRGILGAGDSLNFMGSITEAVDFTKYRGFTGNGAANDLPFYMKWVQRWRQQIQGKVSFIAGVHSSVEPHGNREGRAYRERMMGLVDYRFNPQSCLSYGSNGVLEWTDKAPRDLKNFVFEYFINRKEDG